MFNLLRQFSGFSVIEYRAGTFNQKRSCAVTRAKDDPKKIRGGYGKRRKMTIFVKGKFLEVKIDRLGYATDSDGKMYMQNSSYKWVEFNDDHVSESEVVITPDMEGKVVVKKDGTTWRYQRNPSTLKLEFVKIANPKTIVSLSPSDKARYHQDWGTMRGKK